MFRNAILLFAIGLVMASCSDDSTPKPVSQTTGEASSVDSLSLEIAAAKEFQETGNYAAAISLADSILLNYPGQLDALGIKAEALKLQGNVSGSLAVLEQAYQLQPRDKETVYNLAYEYAEAKSLKALSLTDTLLKYDKTETVARAWYIKGHFFDLHGDEGNALRYFDSATIADYNFIDAHLDKGQVLFRQKNFEGALRSFATGQKVSPATADFYYWVGRTQEVMGNKADAKTNYERAFALDKSMNEARQAAERIEAGSRQ